MHTYMYSVYSFIFNKNVSQFVNMQLPDYIDIDWLFIDVMFILQGGVCWW